MDLQHHYKPPSHSLALVYHHLFSYPLDKHELELWKTSNRQYRFEKKLRFQSYKNNYFLEGYKNNVLVKEKRRKVSVGKNKIAQKASELISAIPTIEFIGITGSLAMNNCKVNSDIDLIVVCKPGTLWSSRLITLLLLKLKRVKTRKAGSKTQKDLICLNMWMETDELRIGRHDLYTAHELLQIKPLVDKDNIFNKLVSSNSWSADFWPNAYKSAENMAHSAKEKQSRRAGEQELCYIFKILNPIAFWFQYFYMKPKITNEQVGYGRALFHPQDGSEWVEKQLAKYGVILNNS